MVAYARRREMEFVRTVHNLYRLSVQKIRSGVATRALRISVCLTETLGFRLRAGRS